MYLSLNIPCRRQGCEAEETKPCMDWTGHQRYSHNIREEDLANRLASIVNDIIDMEIQNDR